MTNFDPITLAVLLALLHPPGAAAEPGGHVANYGRVLLVEDPDVDLPVAVAGLVAAAALTLAALWLERSCRVPPQRDEDRDDRERPGRSGGDRAF